MNKRDSCRRMKNKGLKKTKKEKRKKMKLSKKIRRNETI